MTETRSAYTTDTDARLVRALGVAQAKMLLELLEGIQSQTGHGEISLVVMFNKVKYIYRTDKYRFGKEITVDGETD